jgi:predicted RNA binding protein YcfA (HicA-like mRNA interferase family)
MPKALEYREVVKRVRKERPNIKIGVRRGKGSHRMLFDEERGVHYPLPHHGDDKRRIPPGMLNDLIRMLELPAEIFD